MNIELSIVVGCKPDISTEHVLTTLPFASLYSKNNYLFGSWLPGFVTEDKVKLKGDVVVADANKPLAVILLPDTIQGIALPPLVQDEYEKVGPARELPHFEGNVKSNVPELGKGTFESGVTVNV